MGADIITFDEYKSVESKQSYKFSPLDILCKALIQPEIPRQRKHANYRQPNLLFMQLNIIPVYWLQAWIFAIAYKFAIIY